MFRKSVFVVLSVVLLAGVSYAAGNKGRQAAKYGGNKASSSASSSDMVLPDTDLIDIPTAGILDYYGLQVRNRFMSDGAILPGLSFGVLPRLNLGASAGIQQFIGTGTAMRLVRPELQAKYRFYDGAQHMPALAVGYDGQGYYYDNDAKKYYEKGRGLYLVGSKEVVTPGWQVHPGMNITDFATNKIYFFAGTSYTIEDTLSLMLEWDNIQRIDESRLNTGVRFYVTPFFQLDFGVREIGQNTTFENGARRRPERIVQIRYQTSF